MPAIHLFQRKTLLGGDDLQPSSIVIIGCRFIQLILLIGPLWFHIAAACHRHNDNLLEYMFYDPNDAPDCRHCHLFPLLLVCYTMASTLFTGILGIILQQRIYHWSSIGTPTDPQSRSKHVEQLLEFKLVPFQIIQALVFCTGTSSIAFARQYHKCLEENTTTATATMSNDDFWGWDRQSDNGDDDYNNANFWYTSEQTSSVSVTAKEEIQYLVSKHAWWVAFIILLLSQMIEVVSSCIYLSSLMSRPYQRQYPMQYGHDRDYNDDGESLSSPYHHHELAEEMWKDRCTNFCQFLSTSTCYVFGGKDIALGEFSDVARALTDYLETGGVLDLVPSDLVMGFIMLQRIQRKRTLEARQRVQEERERIQTYGSSLSLNINNTTNSLLQVVDEHDDSNDDSSSTSTTPRPSSQHSSQANESLLVPLEAASTTTTPSLVVAEDTNMAAAQILLDEKNTTNNCGMTQRRAKKRKDNSTTSSTSTTSRTKIELEFQMKKTASRTIFYVPQQRKVLSRHDSYDLQMLQEGARYAKYALAIYTWYLYVYGHPVTGIPKLICKNTCCAFSNNQSRQQQQEEQQSSRQTQSITSSGVAGNDNSNNRKNDMDEDYNENENHTNNIQSSTTASSSATSTPIREAFSEDCMMHQEECEPLMDHEYGVLGDNCCQIHKSALLLQTGLKEADIVYAQLHSSFTQIPYCIVIDHAWDTVVLSIRGTFSLEDCITDVLIEPEPLDELGNEFGFNGMGEHCHGGILRCARIVHDDLERHGILDRLLVGEHASYPNYKLRIVGHSLGGGTATLLSFMMRQKFPSLRCITYSPPGCSMSWGLAIACQEFTTAFILDSDLVPRLSYDAMENFRNEVLELIGRVKVPKMEAASKAISILRWCRMCKEIDLEEDREHLIQTISELLHEPDEVPDSPYGQQLEQFKRIQHERRESRGSVRSIKMFPPGKIIHLVKTGEKKTCCHGLAMCVTCCTSNAGSEYTPVWAGNDDFNEITVSPTMGTDHFPTRICPEIEGIANEYGIDTNQPSVAHGIDRV